MAALDKGREKSQSQQRGQRDKEPSLKSDSMTDSSDSTRRRKEGWRSRFMKDARFRRQIALTVWLCATLFSLGLVSAQLGPAMLDLTQGHVQHGSTLFTASAAGNIVGSLISGVVYDLFSKQALLVVSVVMMGVLTALTPYCSPFPLMAVVVFGVSSFGGSVGTVGNAELVRTWAGKADAPLQALHFTFALGALVAPLITEPFLQPLQPQHSTDHGNIVHSNNTNHDNIVHVHNTNHGNIVDGNNTNHGNIFHGNNTNHGNIVHGNNSNHGNIVHGNNTNQGSIVQGDTNYLRNTVHGNISQGSFVYGNILDHSKASDGKSQGQYIEVNSAYGLAIMESNFTNGSRRFLEAGTETNISISTADTRHIRTTADTRHINMNMADTRYNLTRTLSSAPGMRVHWAFVISASLVILSAVPLVFDSIKYKNQDVGEQSSETETDGKFSESCSRRSELPENKQEAEVLLEDKRAKGVSKIPLSQRLVLPLRVQFLALLWFGLVLICHTGVEATFSNYLTTFTVLHLHWTKSRGAILTSLYWILFATIRGAGMLIVRILSGARLVLLCLLLLVLFLGMFCLSSLWMWEAGVWVSCALVGAAVSPVYPGYFSWVVRQLLPVSGRVSATSILAANTGAMISPMILGQLMNNYSNMWLPYLLLGEATLGCLTFVSLLLFTRLYLHRKYVTVNINKSQNLQESLTGKCRTKKASVQTQSV